MLSQIHEFILILDYLKIPKYKIFKFYHVNSQCESIISDFQNNTNKYYELFSDKEIKEIKNAILSKIGSKTASKLEKIGIKCLFWDDCDYPENLKNIDNPPVVLYYVGDKNLLKQPMISIIGTRTPTRYGKDVTEVFAKSLAKLGIVTVSGLAYGLDGIVASASLDVNGKTIGVLGGGLDKIYPANHTELARKVVKSGGLLLSEYLPGVKPYPSFFVDRNRIIAGLSEGLIITEAGEKSGTLSTAKFAVDFGRELFVIPGNITSEKSSGTNKLIAEMPHSFTISPVEVVERLGLNVSSNSENVNSNLSQMTNDEKTIFEALKFEELNFDDLSEITKFDTKTLATLLTSMEINGLIKKLPGNYYGVVKR